VSHELAMHFEGAAEWVRAAQALCTAAENAQRRGARDEGVKLMKDALRLLENLSERDRATAERKIRKQLAGMEALMVASRWGPFSTAAGYGCFATTGRFILNRWFSINSSATNSRKREFWISNSRIRLESAFVSVWWFKGELLLSPGNVLLKTVLSGLSPPIDGGLTCKTGLRDE
jgi:hypothetical protein